MPGEPDLPEVSCPLIRAPLLPPCDPAELAPLLEWLEEGVPAQASRRFRRGTALPDGRLDLCKQAIGPRGAVLVLGAVTRASKIKHLLLGTNGLGDEGACALSNHLGEGGELETAFLGCNRIGAAGAQALCEALADDTSVRGLWLKRNPLGDEGLQAVAGLLRKNHTLRTLDLVNTGFGGAGLEALVSALREAPHGVERLYLGGNGIDAREAEGIAGLVLARPSLSELYLGANRVGDAGCAALGAALPGSGLRVLSLTSNGIGAEGLEALVAGLEGSALRSLELGHSPAARALGATANQVGDAGARRLAEALERNTSLRRLDLRSNGLTTRGAHALLAGLDSNHTLLELKLGKGIARRAKRAIRALLERNRRARGEGDDWDDEAPADIAAIQSVYR